MVEVPEHLLQRSRERRAALGLGGDEVTAGESPSAAPSGEVEKAEPATPAAAAPAAATEPAEVAPPPPPPPYIQAAKTRPKIPYWVMPVVFLLPLWAVLYVGTLSEAGTGELTPLAEGGELYAQFCASCHGAGGGGGVGPPLSDGAVLETFPDILDQIHWVWLGSEAAVGGTYGAQNTPSEGGMPAFGGQLTPEQILAVVRYTREVLSGEERPDDELGEGEELLWPNGEPWVGEGGNLLDSEGELLFDEDGNLISPALAGAQEATRDEVDLGTQVEN